MLKHITVVAVAVAVALGVAAALTGYTASPAMATARVDVATAASAAAPLPEAGEVLKAKDGHYWADVEVDGRRLHCLVDTGATVVALRPQDAARLGLDPSTLRYDARVDTANGRIHAATVELDHVSVAGAEVDHVPAMVVQTGLAAPLLGMSYLGRLSQFDATPTRLILRP